MNELILQNFRNHEHLKINLAPITLIIGPNGVGKSNILEAIVILSYCRSWREEKKIHLINNGADYAKVTWGEREVRVVREPRCLMQALVNGKVKRLADFVGDQLVVLFTPETLTIITGAPADRRKFLDILLSQKSREYLQALVDYTKVRRQRNQLLRRIKQGLAETGELAYWDNSLVGLADIIYHYRTEATTFLNQGLADSYSQISGKDSGVNIVYERNTTDLVQDLTKHQRREIAEERTIYGPHGDDLEFLLDGRSMKNYASRGETKTAALALKFGEIAFLSGQQRTTNILMTSDEQVRPLLLIDDIFSELDGGRREYLLKKITDYNCVITSTGDEFFPKEFLGRAKIINLS